MPIQARISQIRAKRTPQVQFTWVVTENAPVGQIIDFYNYGSAVYPSGASGIPTGWTEHTS